MANWFLDLFMRHKTKVASAKLTGRAGAAARPRARRRGISRFDGAATLAAHAAAALVIGRFTDEFTDEFA